MLTFIEAHWSEILAITAALWLFYKSEYWPSLVKRREQQHADAAEQAKDEREFLQASQGNALETTIATQRQLIDHILNQSNGKFDEMLRTQSTFNRRIERLEDLMRIISMDWQRLNEILDDIDISLQNLQQNRKPPTYDDKAS